jgi:hypothetical protein
MAAQEYFETEQSAEVREQPLEEIAFDRYGSIAPAVLELARLEKDTPENRDIAQIALAEQIAEILEIGDRNARTQAVLALFDLMRGVAAESTQQQAQPEVPTYLQ